MQKLRTTILVLLGVVTLAGVAGAIAALVISLNGAKSIKI